jgi:hypothetical protein
MTAQAHTSAEHDRLLNEGDDWKRWGAYLSERAWGTVREDYSADGDALSYLPHAHALVYEDALQIPAARLPLRRLGRDQSSPSKSDPEYELLDTGVFAGRAGQAAE